MIKDIIGPLLVIGIVYFVYVTFMRAEQEVEDRRTDAEVKRIEAETKREELLLKREMIAFEKERRGLPPGPIDAEFKVLEDKRDKKEEER